MDLHSLAIHPAAELFPLIDGDDFARLVEDVKTNGLRHPVVVVDGGGKWLVLDGRNRLRACKAAGVAPRHVVLDAVRDPIAYVLSVNLQRRHLNASQRALLAVEVEKMYAAQAPRGRPRADVKSPASLPELSAAERESRSKAASQLNVSGRSVQTAKKVANEASAPVVEAVRAGRIAVDDAVKVVSLPPERQAQLVAKVDAGEAKTLKEALQKSTRAEIVDRIVAEPAPMPAGPFRTIVIDPPWKYESRVEDVSHRGRNPYPDMTVDEICALPVAKSAHDDCVLWLWTTNAFMRDAFRCLDAWGFREKTILTWDKVDIGLGDWLRNVTEHCILAVRGRPVVQLSAQSTLIREKRREHSRKPETFYALVESLCPGSKLEMFARAGRPGWASWGAEPGKFAA
jgi:N6-adenosine-specific RNA methylase IME4